MPECQSYDLGNLHFLGHPILGNCALPLRGAGEKTFLKAEVTDIRNLPRQVSKTVLSLSKVGVFGMCVFCIHPQGLVQVNSPKKTE